MMMTNQQIMERLAQITGKTNNASVMHLGDSSNGRGDEGDIEETSGSSSPTSESISAPVAVGHEIIPDVMEAEFNPSPELKQLAVKWQAEIGITGKLICNKVSMTKKDYLKHIKGMTADKVLDDPLLHVLFRSEEQPEVNFFSWLDRFPKVKNESE